MCVERKDMSHSASDMWHARRCAISEGVCAGEFGECGCGTHGCAECVRAEGQLRRAIERSAHQRKAEIAIGLTGFAQQELLAGSQFRTDTLPCFATTWSMMSLSLVVIAPVLSKPSLMTLQYRWPTD